MGHALTDWLLRTNEFGAESRFIARQELTLRKNGPRKERRNRRERNAVRGTRRQGHGRPAMIAADRDLTEHDLVRSTPHDTTECAALIRARLPRRAASAARSRQGVVHEQVEQFRAIRRSTLRSDRERICPCGRDDHRRVPATDRPPSPRHRDRDHGRGETMRPHKRAHLPSAPGS
jgi:hypothetical protein